MSRKETKPFVPKPKTALGDTCAAHPSLRAFPKIQSRIPKPRSAYSDSAEIVQPSPHLRQSVIAIQLNSGFSRRANRPIAIPLDPHHQTKIAPRVTPPYSLQVSWSLRFSSHPQDNGAQQPYSPRANDQHAPENHQAPTRPDPSSTRLAALQKSTAAPRGNPVLVSAPGRGTPAPIKSVHKLAGAEPETKSREPQQTSAILPRRQFCFSSPS